MRRMYILLFSMLMHGGLQNQVCAQADSAYAQKEVPNVVVLIADDVSWNDFGCYGNTFTKTPNIDRLASTGMMFNNAILTASSCSPSRVSIMTGRYPHNTGAAELHTEPTVDFASIASQLKDNGYYTGQAGKWHMGELLRSGFDRIYDKGKQENGDGGEKMWIPSLKERDKDKPFFFWFASYDAHRPWGPNRFSKAIDPKQLEVPITLVDNDSTRLDLSKYFIEVKRFDFYVGEVVKELKKQGVYDNTIILVMADNGRPFPRDKTRLYDSGMKTPFIVHWPRQITQSSVTNSLISSVDIAPTLLDLCQVSAPESFQGKSFKKLFSNPTMRFRKYAFSEHNWHDYQAYERMARTEDFIYIQNARPQLANQGPADAVRSPSFRTMLAKNKEHQLTPAQYDVFLSPRPTEELFSCKEDSLQLKNLIGEKEFETVYVTLKGVLEEWMDQTGDNIPTSLTEDWFDRKTGEKIEKNLNIRGEMPGVKSGAEKNNTKGGF